jgi:hypothetical protein
MHRCEMGSDLADSCALKVARGDCTHRQKALGTSYARPRANDRLELPDGTRLERTLGPAEREYLVTHNRHIRTGTQQSKCSISALPRIQDVTDTNKSWLVGGGGLRVYGETKWIG